MTTLPSVQEWLDMAMKLEGHAPPELDPCGWRRDLQEARSRNMRRFPATKRTRAITTQYTMNNLSDLGLLKMDFLGLRTLTVIRDAVAMMKENRGVDIGHGSICPWTTRRYMS